MKRINEVIVNSLTALSLGFSVLPAEVPREKILTSGCPAFKFGDVADLNAGPGQKGHIIDYEFDTDKEFFEVEGYDVRSRVKTVTLTEPPRTYKVTIYEYADEACE